MAATAAMPAFTLAAVPQRYCDLVDADCDDVEITYGHITSIDSDQEYIKINTDSDDGYDYKVKIDGDDTEILKNGQNSSISSFDTGDFVVVVGEVSGKTIEADVIDLIDQTPIQPANAFFTAAPLLIQNQLGNTPPVETGTAAVNFKEMSTISNYGTGAHRANAFQRTTGTAYETGETIATGFSRFSWRN